MIFRTVRSEALRVAPYYVVELLNVHPSLRIGLMLCALAGRPSAMRQYNQLNLGGADQM